MSARDRLIFSLDDRPAGAVLSQEHRIPAGGIDSATKRSFQRLRFSADRPEARAQVRHRRPMGERSSRRGAARAGEGPARAELAPPGGRRDRPDPFERLFPVRPGPGHDRARRRRSRALLLGLRRGRPRDVLRDGPRAAGRGRRRHRHGDDEVVRHELSLHRPRARARHELPPRLDEAF